jgi:hypothetical protein
MDPPTVDERASRRHEWSPALGLVILGWLGALCAAAWCVLLWTTHADPAGRLLAGIAAAGLLVAALFGTRARPRLRADADGLTVGGLLRTRHYPWPLVRDIRVIRVRRLGLRNSLLEIDTVSPTGGERLLVFGRLDLAEDPQDVAPQLLALRAAR